MWNAARQIPGFPSQNSLCGQEVAICREPPAVKEEKETRESKLLPLIVSTYIGLMQALSTL